MSTYSGVNICLAYVLKVKALVDALNQEKALVARGLLCDCEIFANVRFELYCSGGITNYVPR